MSIFGNTSSQNTGNSMFGGNKGNSLFGSTNNNNTGSIFGSNTTSNAAGSLFGSNKSNNNASGSLFGGTTNSAGNGSLFGSNTTSTSNTAAGSLFSSNTTGNTGSLFGNTLAKTTQSGSLFGNNQSGSLFSSNNTQNNSSSLFGKPAGSLFGAPAATNTASTSIFGANNTASTSLFGNNNATNSGSLLGGSTQNNSLFSSNNQQQANSLFGQSHQIVQPSNINNPSNTNQSVDAFYISLSQPCIFGDDRDGIIAKYNQLLAMWASNGQGFCSLGPVTYSKDNVFSRFKAIVYNILPVSTDEDGLVRLTIKQPCKELIKHSQQIKETLFRILESKPNIAVQIEEIRPSLGKESETESELTIRVVESRNRASNIDQSSSSGQIISASLLCSHLTSPNVASQLNNSLTVTNVTTELAPSQASLNSYCKTPPAGFDKMVWQQFILENPRRDCLIPVPLLGIEELKIRKREQIVFGNQQKATLIKISESLRKIEARNAVISQKIFGLKSKQFELSHRILKVIAKKEVSRKSGYAISAEEEMQRGNLEKLVTQLKSMPSQNFSRINSVGAANGGLRQRMSAIMAAVNEIEKNSKSLQQSDVDVGIDSDSMKELVEYLANKSKGINEMRLMVNIISEKISVVTNYSSGSSHFSGSHQSTETRPKVVSFA